MFLGVCEMWKINWPEFPGLGGPLWTWGNSKVRRPAGSRVAALCGLPYLHRKQVWVSWGYLEAWEGGRESLERGSALEQMWAPRLPRSGPVKFMEEWTSLVVQWLRLCTPNAGGWGSIPGQRTRPHMLQLRVCMLHLKPGAAKQTRIKKNS